MKFDCFLAEIHSGVNGQYVSIDLCSVLAPIRQQIIKKLMTDDQNILCLEWLSRFMNEIRSNTLIGSMSDMLSDIRIYPMLRADSRFWLVNNREIWSRISRLTSSAWDIKTKERHWWRHNGDSDRRPLSLPLRYDLVILCLYDDLGQINVIAGILKLRKRFRMSQILSEHGINSLPLVCFRGYGNLSTLSIAIPRLAFGRAWYCDAACG